MEDGACWIGIPAKRPYGVKTEHDQAFAVFEEVMAAHGGRPHWAKQHSQPSSFFAASYPRWADFHAVRQRLDSGGTFLNEYLRELFGIEEKKVLPMSNGSGGRHDANAKRHSLVENITAASEVKTTTIVISRL